jgi:hypothetical protein
MKCLILLHNSAIPSGSAGRARLKRFGHEGQLATPFARVAALNRIRWERPQFGAAFGGGGKKDYRFRIAKAGTNYMRLRDFGATARASASAADALLPHGNGFLYGSSCSGVAFDLVTVFKLAPGGSICMLFLGALASRTAMVENPALDWWNGQMVCSRARPTLHPPLTWAPYCRLARMIDSNGGLRMDAN